MTKMTEYFFTGPIVHRLAVNTLMTCGHPHWFSVKMGDPVLALTTTPSGAHCIGKILEEPGVTANIPE